MKFFSALSETKAEYLDGQFLIAMPAMQDPRFSKSIIYMCAHSGEGAMGITINKHAETMKLGKLIAQLELKDEKELLKLPNAKRTLKLMHGGPVEPQRGFILHSRDYFIPDVTLPVTDDICLTVSVDILRAMAQGKGPKQCLLSLGYTGWTAGQLEEEIQANGWLNCTANAQLLFDEDSTDKYERVLRSMGVDPMMLSLEAGHT
jgi:putative transcriptional regulator